MANDCIPTKLPGDPFSAKAGSAITGKRFVKVSAARTGGGVNAIGTDLLNLPVCAPCAATTDVPIGVSGADAASGGVFEVYGRGSGICLPVTAGGTVTAGQQVQTDATGQVITLASGIAVGVAMDSATSGNDCEVKLF